MEYLKKLYQPQEWQSYDQFKQGTVENIYSLFDVQSKSDVMTLQNFLENTDHGLEHEYNVYQKAIEITDRYEQQTDTQVRKHMLYPMAIVHDAMRSLQYSPTDKQKARKEKRNDRNHEKYGAFLFEKMIQSWKQRDIFINLSEQEQAEIKEYLINHDYFSEQLNGGRFHELTSIEGQIVRLADRISIPLKDEIQRYWDTWKRLNTPFFNQSMPLSERENFSFDKMGLYFKNGWVDEVLFFIALLMITEKDFSDPVLGEIYKEWAVDKDNAIDFILDIGKQEGATPEQMEDLKVLLSHLGEKYGFHVKG